MNDILILTDLDTNYIKADVVKSNLSEYGRARVVIGVDTEGIVHVLKDNYGGSVLAVSADR